MKVIELLYYMNEYVPITIYYAKNIPIISDYSQNIEKELKKIQLERSILDADVKKIDLDGEKEEIAIII